MKTIFTKDEFLTFVKDTQAEEGYKNPIGFGICRVDLGQKDQSKVLQASFPLTNWNENMGSASVFISAIKELGAEVDFSQTELVYSITKKFLEASLRKFTPFISETGGEAHKNIQVIDQLKNRADLQNFRLVFIFEDAPLKSVEATYLKLYALSQKKSGT